MWAIIPAPHVPGTRHAAPSPAHLMAGRQSRTGRAALRPVSPGPSDGGPSRARGLARPRLPGTNRQVIVICATAARIRGASDNHTGYPPGSGSGATSCTTRTTTAGSLTRAQSRSATPARSKRSRIRIRIDVGFGLGSVQDEQRFMIQQEAEVRRPARQLPDPLVHPVPRSQWRVIRTPRDTTFQAEDPGQAFVEQPTPGD